MEVINEKTILISKKELTFYIFDAMAFGLFLGILIML